MNYRPGELFDSGGDLIYYERVEKIFDAERIERLNTWELDFIDDLYWNPREVRVL